MSDEAGKDVPLTRGEFHLLRAFVQRPGRVLSRDQLLQMLAGRDAELYDRSIDMLVVRLRRKIEPDPKRPSLIVTLPGSGYKFAAKVTAEAAGAPVAGAVETAPPVSQPSPPAAPERRQLTILHCALTGPAFARAQRDPEDLQRLLADFHRYCETVVAPAGGTIDRGLSDGILVYFGHPQADEHQAERALRTALKLVATRDQIDTGQLGALQIRIGVATGLAVVGGQQGTPGALGEAANVAAKLAFNAEPVAILISASTRRLVGGLFQCRATASIATDAAGEPIEAWQVMGEGIAEGRFEALHGPDITDLLGRDEELELLLRRWSKAKTGSSKVVLISGEPGIGKSRLTRAFRDAIAGEKHTELRFFCSPHHQDSALYPVLSQLERAAGFAPDDNADTKRVKLASLLAQSNATEEAVALITDLLSIPTDQRERLQQMSPQARRERTLGALVAHICGLAAQRPVLVIFEDIHWIDPTSREWLDRGIEQLERLPVLLLATFRPEFQPPWTGQANVTSLALTRLDRRDAATMIAAIAGRAALPAGIAREIAERTDGVPLFIEEVTRAVIEAGANVDEAPLSSTTHRALSVPATLDASLIARLDRLGPAAKEIAQRGAVIGREFPYELVASVSHLTELELREGLDRLTGSGLLSVRGVPPHSNYAFKHALVQEAAYGLLLRSQREQLHAEIAASLESHFPEIAATQPALLARHFTEAGLTERAIASWLKAGQDARARSMNIEAVALLRKGLALLPGLSDNALRDRHELALQIALGVAQMVVRGEDAPVVGEIFGHVLHLCNRIDPSKRIVPTFGLWAHNLVRGEFGAARDLSAQICQFGEEQNDDAARLIGCYASGITNFLLGELGPAIAYLENGLILGDPGRRTLPNRRWAESWGAFAPGWDRVVRVSLLGCLSSALAASGYLDRSQVHRDTAMAEGRFSGAMGQAYAISWFLTSPGLLA